MSILTPAAAAILNTLQAGIKGDAKTADAGNNGDFLSLLESGGGNEFHAGAQSEQGLVDTLYEKDDEPEAPVAVPQVSAHIFEENPAPVKNAAPEKPAMADAQAQAPREEKIAAPQQQPKAAAQKNTQEKPAGENEQVKGQSAQSLSAVRSKQAGGQASTENTAATVDTTAETLSLADKIGAKVNELGDLLSSIAAILGVAPAAQITVTHITQTSLTVTQENLGVNQPFADLSDRFEQLMGVLASLNKEALPAGVQQNLGQAMGAFQSLFQSLLPQGSAMPDAQLVNDRLAQCTESLQVTLQSISFTTTTVTTASGAPDMQSLAAQLEKMQQWLQSFQPLATQVAEQAPAAASPEDADIAAVIASITQSSIKGSTKSSARNVAPKAAVETAAATTAPVVQAAIPQTATAPVTSAAPAATAVAAAAENTGLQTGLQNGNQQQSGQGANQSAAPVAAAGAQGATGTSAAQHTGFGKMLKETHDSKPLAEQVAVNIKTAVKDGASKIQIRLDPAELGKLHIKLELATDGTAKGIIITADSRATLDLLQRDARGLENALADAGIKAESGSLSFNLNGGEQQQAQEENTRHYGGYQPLIEEEDALAPLAVISRNYVVDVADGLDIKI